MRVEFYGLVFESPRITVYLWSPWRASALEHRMFEAIKQLPNATFEAGPDERMIHLTELKTWRAAVQALSRVLKGWQEEAEPGSERRLWRWLIEGDTDGYGYDHSGEPTSVWGYLQVCVDRGGPQDQEKGEVIDLEDFGLRIWSEISTRI